MIKIPERLKDINFRFYLIGKDSKIPQEKKWNSVNNYPYFHSKLINHLKADCNYGICTGFGNLIIIDFDSYDFYEKVKKKLPWTFTSVSANKRYPHYYYLLNDGTIKKVGINDNKGNRSKEFQIYP